MSDVSPLRRRISGLASVDEARAWIDQTLEANGDLTPKGIRVSNSFHEDGLRGEYRGIRIAMDPGPDFYPDDTVEIEFE